MLSVCDRHTYLVVFETATAPAFVVVKVPGFGAVDATGLLAVTAKTMDRHETETEITSISQIK